jgi:hypothetical protein
MTEPSFSYWITPAQFAMHVDESCPEEDLDTTIKLLKNIDHFTNNTSECRICLSDHTSIQLFLMTGQNREVNVEIRISPNHKCPHCNDVTHFECTLRMYRAQQHIQCLRCRQNIIT